MYSYTYKHKKYGQLWNKKIKFNKFVFEINFSGVMFQSGSDRQHGFVFNLKFSAFHGLD